MSSRVKITIDLRSHEPIYLQIIDRIKELVASGEMKPDDQLPTVRQLAADMRINFNTVARAYRVLDEEGIISTQHGRGTYILGLPSEENGEKLRREVLISQTLHYLAEAEKLGFSPDEVNDVVEQNLTVWRESGSPPLPEDRSQ
jgi:GntR family transcriptional regulator